MSDLGSKFDDLGYGMIDFESIIYAIKDPLGQVDPKCADHCISCAVSCSTCGAGCSSGTSGE